MDKPIKLNEMVGPVSDKQAKILMDKGRLEMYKETVKQQIIKLGLPMEKRFDGDGWFYTESAIDEIVRLIDQAIQATREDFVKDLKCLSELDEYRKLEDRIIELISKYSPQQKEEI